MNQYESYVFMVSINKLKISQNPIIHNIQQLMENTVYQINL